MTTTCLDCMVSTGVGEMSGSVGLPSLSETPRGRGNHKLSKKLSLGWDADTDETFGYVRSGFLALGLHIHALETYRGFLHEHSEHRVFEWTGDEDDEYLPSELQGGDRTKFLAYRGPQPGEGYVSRKLVFGCPKCQDRFESDTVDWVKPLDPTTLTVEQIKLFRKSVGEPSECCIREADPFGILYMDLDDWLKEHRRHKPVMSLEDRKGM